MDWGWSIHFQDDSHIWLLTRRPHFLLTLGTGTWFLTTWPFHRAVCPHGVALTPSRAGIQGWGKRDTVFYNIVSVEIYCCFRCILWFQQTKPNIVWEETGQGWEYWEMRTIWVHLGSWLWYHPQMTMVSFCCDILYYIGLTYPSKWFSGYQREKGDIGRYGERGSNI